MEGRILTVLSIVGVMLLVGGCGGGSSGDGSGGTIEANFLKGGDYSAVINLERDTCGLGIGGGFNGVVFVQEAGTTLTVDFTDGAGGCNPFIYSRIGENVVRRTGMVSAQVTGSCAVDVASTTTLTWTSDNYWSAFETNHVIAKAGFDCSGIALPCDVDLRGSGTRCSGCFACSREANPAHTIGALGYRLKTRER